MPGWWDRMPKLRRRRAPRDAVPLETPSRGRAIATIFTAFAVLAVCAVYTRQTGSNGQASDQAASKATQQVSASRLGDISTDGGSLPEDAGPAGAFPWLYGYEIVRELPHQADAFTQGLEYDKRCANTATGDGFECTDIFWESTGMNGVSSVREVDMETGDVLRQRTLAHEDFAEGVTRLNGRLYQLTWRSSKLFSYDASNFDDVKQLATPLQDGWGIATDGASLIVSDSGPTLYWLDARTLREQRRVDVHDGTREVPWVNELEWVDGELWGNVWQTECIARIDPKTGLIRGWILLSGLLDAARRASKGRHIDVLNGIAWDAAGKRLFVTGKYWPRMYQVEVRRLTGAAADSKAVNDARNVCIPKIAAVGWR